MANSQSTVLLKHHLKQLKLPMMHAECEKLAAQAARENQDKLAFLLRLCELELIERERKAAERRRKAAKFPAHKTLDTFDENRGNKPHGLRETKRPSAVKRRGTNRNEESAR